MVPIKDPKRRAEVQAAWRKRAAEAGYHKALYERRKRRWANEEGLRHVVTEALSLLRRGQHTEASLLLADALWRFPEVKGTPLHYLHAEGRESLYGSRLNRDPEERRASARKGGLAKAAKQGGAVRTRFRPDGEVRRWKPKSGS